MEIHRLVYRSAPLTPAVTQILDIVRATERRNPALGCSGMQFYADGAYAQLIEGPHAGVAALWASLSRDPRHRVLWSRMSGAPGRQIEVGLPMGFLSEGEARSCPAFLPVLELLAREVSDRPHSVWAADGARPIPGLGLGRALAEAARYKYPTRALGTSFESRRR